MDPIEELIEKLNWFELITEFVVFNINGYIDLTGISQTECVDSRYRGVALELEQLMRKLLHTYKTAVNEANMTRLRELSGRTVVYGREGFNSRFAKDIIVIHTAVGIVFATP